MVDRSFPDIRQSRIEFEYYFVVSSASLSLTHHSAELLLRAGLIYAM